MEWRVQTSSDPLSSIATPFENIIISTVWVDGWGGGGGETNVSGDDARSDTAQQRWQGRIPEPWTDDGCHQQDTRRL
ncbi:hypothetical protein VTO42DRAFT_7055 [Malbranchea cinnamomea]